MHWGLLPIYEQFFHGHWNSREISLSSHPSCRKVIIMKFCTWHNSCAVMACAKICSDMTPYDEVTLKKKATVHWIWITMEKAFVNRLPFYKPGPLGPGDWPHSPSKSNKALVKFYLRAQYTPKIGEFVMDVPYYKICLGSLKNHKMRVLGHLQKYLVNWNMLLGVWQSAMHWSRWWLGVTSYHLNQKWAITQLIIHKI